MQLRGAWYFGCNLFQDGVTLEATRHLTPGKIRGIFISKNIFAYFFSYSAIDRVMTVVLM